MKPFTYTPLDLDRPAFRLFRLFKGSYASISGELFQAWIDRPESIMPFEALSYRWGEPVFTEMITLNKGWLNITKNLHLALKSLRHRDCDRILWIDAICIDQDNPRERGHQVQQMKDVYAAADTVICWLGSATYETNVLMQSLKLLKQESMRCASGGWTNSNWSDLWSSIQPVLEATYSDVMALQKAGFEAILQEDWFKRVWIIQEVANAKRARVQCGDLSVSAQVFQLAPELLSIRIEPHCKSILDVMPGKRRGTSWWIESRDLYSLLKHFRGSEALDSRDMIFALLGIASDLGENKHIIADYTKSAKDITRDIIRHLYHVDLNLEFRGIKDFLYALESLNTDALISLISSTAGLDKMSESIIRILQRGKDVYISQAVTGAAAQNMRNGEAIMSILFHHAKTNIPVTAEVVADATANNTQGKEIVSFLFKHAKTEVPITAEVVTAAASNRMQGREIMSFLFQHAKKKIPITAGVVTAAAANGIQGKEIMTLLFQHAKQEIPITDTVVAAAAANSIQGKEIMSTIFENLKNRLLTTSEVGAATAVSSSAFTPKFRLHERMPQ